MSKAVQSQDVVEERAVQDVRSSEQDMGEEGACRLWMQFVQTKE